MRLLESRLPESGLLLPIHLRGDLAESVVGEMGDLLVERVRMFSINDQAITGAQSLAMEEHNDYNIK